VPIIDAQGRQVFPTASGQFLLVVEGKPGLSHVTAATSLFPLLPDNRPAIWIQSNRALGNGSSAVCDTGPPSSGGGGIPGIDPPGFAAEDAAITNALNDFACRFDPSVNAANPCTILDVTREPHLIKAGSTVQFCDFVAGTSAFPPGDTVLSLALRDNVGNTGPTAQIVVRVVPPTPTPPKP
jgi:hypothetical protein